MLADENKDSSKWRAMTVQQLKTGDVEKFNGDVQIQLIKAFESMLRELGYEVNETAAEEDEGRGFAGDFLRSACRWATRNL
jgi:hypothetical protein